MELIKVHDIINYIGRLYIIRPYIEEGKIKRKTIFTVVKETNKFNDFGGSYSLGRIGGLDWHQTIFHRFKRGDVIDENTEANGRTARWPIRFFTDRESAKKGLEEYESQNAYNLSESIDKELKRLENEKKEINKKIKELKERKKECFSKLTTSFVKKS